MLIKKRNQSLLFTDATLERLSAGEIPIHMLGAGGGLTSRAIRLDAAGPDDAHTIEELPTYLAGYRQAQYVADEIAPTWKVPNINGKYRTMDANNVFKRVNVTAGFEDPVPEIGVTSSLVEFRVTVRFCGAFVSGLAEANATAYSPMQQSAKRAANALMLDREMRVFELAQTLGTWNANNRVTLGGTGHWSTGSASAPIDDLRARVREKSFALGTHDIWMNWNGVDALLAHAQVRDYLRFYRGDSGLTELIAKTAEIGRNDGFSFMLPQIGMVRVAPARVLNETSSNVEYILQNDVIIVWGDKSVPTDGETLHTFKTPIFRGVAGVGYETRRFFVPNRGPVGGEMVVVAAAEVVLCTGPQIGGLVKSAY